MKIVTYGEKHCYTEASPHASGSEVSEQGQGDANWQTNQVVESKVEYCSDLLSTRASNDTSKCTLHESVSIDNYDDKTCNSIFNENRIICIFIILPYLFE